jgi:hypothetical protein
VGAEEGGGIGEDAWLKEGKDLGKGLLVSVSLCGVWCSGGSGKAKAH